MAQIGCRPFIGLAEYGRVNGLDYVAAKNAVPVQETEIVTSIAVACRPRARSNWLEA